VATTRRSATNRTGPGSASPPRRSPRVNTGTFGSAQTSGQRAPRRLTITTRAAVLLLVLAALALTLAFPVKEFLQQRSQINALKDQVSQAQVHVSALRAQQLQWQDPNYVEAQARERLHFVYPGEIGFVLLTPRDAKRARQPVLRTAPQEITPWYSTLWSSIRQADQP
jgi:cell division protein FtsB